MAFTDKQIINIASTMLKYLNICNSPDEQNNITINDNVISLIENGSVVLKKELNVSSLKQQLKHITYTKNVFINNNSKFSPLEADKSENKYVWKKNHKGIDFPKFMPIPLFSLLLIEQIPSILDVAKIYMSAYNEILPDNEALTSDDRLSYYKNPNAKDRNRIGATTIYDNQIITNALLRFRLKIFKPFVHNLPINEFSIEHMCYRVYKLYGSIMRDIYHAVFFNTYNLKTEYSYYKDLNGIDLFLNDIPVYSYTNTDNSINFAKDKSDLRHNDLPIGIRLRKNIYCKQTNGFYFLSDDAVNRVIEEVKKGIPAHDIIIDG